MSATYKTWVLLLDALGLATKDRIKALKKAGTLTDDEANELDKKVKK